MATKKPAKAAKPAKSVETIPAGTEVTYHYRSATGHGTVTGVSKKGTTAANTEYSIAEHDHHPGEPAVVHHYGSALHKVSGGAAKKAPAAKSAKSPSATKGKKK